MANINWSLAGTASKGTWSNATETNDVSTINDDNEATYHQGAAAGGGAGGFSTEDIVTFSESANSITSVALVSAASGSDGGIKYCYIYLYYSSAWNLVYTIWGGPGATTWVKRTNTDTGSWSDVTAIKVYFEGAYVAGFAGQQTYELRAWGPENYIDIGKRIGTSSGTVVIAGETLTASHKLRTRKGATTYGIPLITPGAADDSGIRIYDGSAVKALPKIT